MDLIYTNAEWEDVGVLKDYAFDLAFGTDENDFELSIETRNHCCIAGCLVYIEGTEYGGIIDGLELSTKDESITYQGRTWHGILESKIIQPDNGAAYLEVYGDANKIIGGLLERLALTDLFIPSEEASLNIGGYSFGRYVNAYKGITSMLNEAGGKLVVKFQSGRVVLAAVPAIDYSKNEEFDNNQVEMEIKKVYKPVNHLICLGKGELADREVIHLYLDANGRVSTTQHFFGLDEIVDIYDYSNAESTEELIKGGTKKLLESADTIRLDFNGAEQTIYDIGDIVGAREIITGILAADRITKKIVAIKNGTINIEYKIGE